jgi:hypothetical protein
VTGTRFSLDGLAVNLVPTEEYWVVQSRKPRKKGVGRRFIHPVVNGARSEGAGIILSPASAPHLRADRSCHGTAEVALALVVRAPLVNYSGLLQPQMAFLVQPGCRSIGMFKGMTLHGNFQIP